MVKGKITKRDLLKPARSFFGVSIKLLTNKVAGNAHKAKTPHLQQTMLQDHLYPNAHGATCILNADCSNAWKIQSIDILIVSKVLKKFQNNTQAVIAGFTCH